ncbi:hypothetical protein GWK47_020362 [Chionoecetes opilio]|uniref:Uncharacterized protein n=1 Tax=Chionoecetes opilio TaxID=41210 RepID=A0A8J4XQ82_CHIOP|nr:hypothetical protein GWK47_020362 [Chionoecetes opilio]
MSVEGSHSGTATPVGLSEAPTPVDSKAPTPIPSGRTSPVLDTGQDKEIDKKDGVDDKKVEKDEERVTQKLEMEKELLKVEVKTNVDTECKSEKEKLPGEVMDVLDKNKKVLNLSQSEVPKHKGGTGDTEKKDSDRPEENYTKLSLTSEEVEEKQTSKDVGKTQEQKLNNEGKRRTEEETDEKKVDSTTEKVTENEKDTDKVENVDEVKEQLITECKSKMAECEDDKNRKEIEIPSEVESCEKENLKKETVIKTEAAENTIEKTDKVKSELINEAAENTNKKTDKVKSELENETAENTNEKTDKVKSALKYETAENTQEKTDKVKSELEYETAENTNEKTDKVKSALKNETAESSNEKTDKVKSALKNETAENTDGKTEKFKSKLKNEVAEHTDGKTDKLKSDLKNEEAKNTDGKTDKLKSELEKKVETADQKVPSNEDIEESEKNGNKSRNRDEDSKEKEKTTKVQIKHAESTEVEGGPSQKGAHVEQQKSLSTENVAEATEKKVEEVVCGKKSGKMLETMEVDDNTKEICLDIAAKKTMLVRERGSQEILESKGPKFGLIERTETKKKESVWDKLNKMKEKGEAKSEETGERKKETNPCLPLSADKHPKEEEKQEHSSHSTPKEDARIKSSNTTFTIQRAWEDKVTTKPGPSVLSESSLAPPKQQQQQAPKLMSIESLVGPPTRPLNLPSQPVPAVIRSSIGGLQPTTKDDMTEPPLKKFKFSDMSSLESHSESRVSDSKFTQETSPSDPPPLPPSPALPPQAAKGDKDRITQKNEIEEKVVSLSSIRSVESEEKVYQKDDAKLSAQSENPAQDRPDKNRTYNSGDERHPEAGGSHSTVEGEMTQQEKTEESKGKNKDHNPTVEAVSKIDTRIPGKEVKITETVITAAVESKIECQVTDSVKSTTQKPYDNPLEEVKEDSSSGAIEEPVMLIKGDGEGAMCEGGNDLFHSQDFFPALAQPWWEHFGENNATRASVGETIEEGVMYFWGEGTGAECEAGNNGDETETSSDTNKQGEGGGSGGTVATDSQRNTAVADLKTAKEVEDIKTDGDVKAVDGVCEGDEAKVNGLRTVESVDKTTDKSESQDDQSNEVSDAKHASVNGKKVNEENSVCDEHDDGLQLKASGGCEKIMVKEVKEEEKKRANTEQILSVTQESKKCKSDISDNVKVEGCEVKSNEEEKERRKNKKETVKDKDGSEEEGIGDEEEIEEEEEGDVEEEEEEEEEVDEEDEDEEERRSKKKHKEKLGSSYMKKQVQHDSAVGQQGTMRGRGRPHKRNAEQQESEEEEDDQEEDYHDEDDDGPEGDENEQYHTMPPARKRRQRGKGSTSRPLPDVPRQKSARIAKIREKEEQERRELEAIRLNQLAEENRMREIKKKAREERRSSSTLSFVRIDTIDWNLW